MLSTLLLVVTSSYAFEGIHSGSTWSYHDLGGDPNGVTTAWYEPSFDDSAWSSGAGSLGFGGATETIISDHGGLAYYFRASFEVDSAAAITDAFLDLAYDDGAVVWLNGVELDRWDMPAGAVDHNTSASASTVSPVELVGEAIDVSYLVDGTNVLAVEVHQWSTASSDVHFEAQLSLSPHILAGPWLVEPAEDGVVVMWESYDASSGQVDYGTSSAYGSSATDFTVDYLHRVELSGLSVDTEYHYQVTSGGYASEDRSFRTLPPVTATDMVFVAYGDTRSNPDIHSELAELILAEDPAMVFNSGDLVGSGDSQDEWYQQFFAPAHAYMPTQPVVVVPGNHESEEYYPTTLYWDYLPSGSATTPYWSSAMGPARFLLLDSNDPEFNGKTEYCHADGVITTTTCAHSVDCEDYSGVTWTCDADPTISAQYVWLEGELSSATEPFIFVIQHHPVYSSGFHATSVEVQTMEAYMAPLYEVYGVTAVMVGHDHRYERSYAYGTHYLTLGGGGAEFQSACTDPAAPPDRCSNDYQQYAQDSYCYGVFEITAGEVWLDVFDETGTAIEAASILLTNDAPTISVLDPDGLCDTADEELDISYSASDPDSDASISFYLDSDASGCDGTLLSSGISEDDGYTSEVVDVSSFADGEYWVYALIEDELEQDCSYAPGSVRIDHPTVAGDVLLPLGSTWSYWDGGSLPVRWNRPFFNDSWWSSGCGELGYGDGDEQTTLNSGEITAYFRTEFEFYGSTPSALAMEAAIDDGVAVYLNGRPVRSVNMPAGLPTHTTLASGALDGDPRQVFMLRPGAESLLLYGTNFLAVEVHQWNPTSSDLSWDARLIAIP